MNHCSQQQMMKSHTLLIATTGLCGLAEGISVSVVQRFFQWNCPLNANLPVTYNAVNKTVTVLANAVWGETKDCHFTTYIGIGIFITSLIWVWFFMHMSENFVLLDRTISKIPREMKNKLYRELPPNIGFDKTYLLPQLTKLRSNSEILEDRYDLSFALPVLLTDVFLFVCSIVNFVKLNNGISTFCVNTLANKGLNNVTCSDLQNSIWIITLKKVQKHVPFIMWLNIAYIFSVLLILMLFSLIILTLVQAYRISDDYISTFSFSYMSSENEIDQLEFYEELHTSLMVEPDADDHQNLFAPATVKYENFAETTSQEAIFSQSLGTQETLFWHEGIPVDQRSSLNEVHENRQMTIYNMDKGQQEKAESSGGFNKAGTSQESDVDADPKERSRTRNVAFKLPATMRVHWNPRLKKLQ